MTSSLLSLPDEALRLIFLALGSDTFDDCCNASMKDGASEKELCTAARYNLASCCKRLNTIYRSTVRTMSLSGPLGDPYDEADCALLWETYPRSDSLAFYLDFVPGFEYADFTTQASPGPWCGTPAAFPAGMVRNGIKSIVLLTGCMHLRELQAMLERFTGLEALEFDGCGVHVDSGNSDADSTFSFSLERHATALKKLALDGNSICNLPGNKVRARDTDYQDVDLRWLQLPTLPALRHLELSYLNLIEGPFSQLAELTDLESLSLKSMQTVKDEQLQAVLPSLPHLRTVKLVDCHSLTSRVLQWLPLDLDALQVTGSIILTESLGGAEEIETSRFSSKVRKGTRSVKHLVAGDTGSARKLTFKHFLQVYDGASITHLNLCRSFFLNNYGSENYGSEMRILSSTPNLLQLSLDHKETDEGVFSAISRLSDLRDLNMTSYKLGSVDHLRILATGPCRHSLRRIGLCEADKIVGIAAFRRFVSERFDRCVVNSIARVVSKFDCLESE